MQKAGLDPGKEDKDKDLGNPASDKDNCPSWVRGSSSSSAVKMEPQCHKLLANQDSLNRGFWLKSRIGGCLQSLAESLPSYTDKDLLVCHRQNDKGIWKEEVWTRRDFNAHEILFAPLVSQIKDTHLTLQANVVLGIPKNGRGAHPEGQSLALDGRGKTILAKSGSIHGSEHTGILFWLVSRTSIETEANMFLENISWEQHVTLQMPFKKKKMQVDWEASELPSIPILMNKEGIKAQTKLMVFLADKKENKKA